MNKLVANFLKLINSIEHFAINHEDKIKLYNQFMVFFLSLALALVLIVLM